MAVDAASHSRTSSSAPRAKDPRSSAPVSREPFGDGASRTASLPGPRRSR